MSKEEIPQPIIIIEGKSPESPNHPWVRFMQKYHLRQWIDQGPYTLPGSTSMMRYICYNKKSFNYLKANTNLPVINKEEYDVLMKYRKAMIKANKESVK